MSSLSSHLRVKHRWNLKSGIKSAGARVPELNAINALGAITAVIANETGVDELTLYEIQFDFGAFTLYGSQIEESRIPRPDRRRLFISPRLCPTGSETDHEKHEKYAKGTKVGWRGKTRAQVVCL